MTTLPHKAQNQRLAIAELTKTNKVIRGGGKIIKTKNPKKNSRQVEKSWLAKTLSYKSIKKSHSGSSEVLQKVFDQIIFDF